MSANATRLRLALSLLAALAVAAPARAQAGFDDDRVMLQGFYWESYRHGDPDPRFAKFGAKSRPNYCAKRRGAVAGASWRPPV